MMKVTMETARALQKIKRAYQYEPLSYDGEQYVQIEDLDTLNYDCRCDVSYWEGYAIRLGDEIDEYGYAPVYNLIWFLDHPDEEDGCDTVDDWETIDDVNEIGEIEIATGYIV